MDERPRWRHAMAAHLPGVLRARVPSWVLRWGVVVRRTMPGTAVRCSWKVASRHDVYRVASAWVKEPGTIEWIRDEVRQGDVVWDVGANIGIYTVPLGHKVRGTGGRVIAVEPNLANAVSLMTNVLLNDLGEIVSVVAEPMSASNTLGEMFMDSDLLQSGKSGVQFGNAGTLGSSAHARRHGATRYVRAISAEDLCIASRSTPQIVKIDVDGLDYDILVGMRGVLLGAKRPRLVSVEMLGGEPRFVEFMCGVGYRLREMNFGMLGARKIRSGRDPSTVSGNGIFVPVEDAPRR